MKLQDYFRYSDQLREERPLYLFDGEVNRWSWRCVGLGFGVEGGCCHGCMGSEKL